MDEDFYDAMATALPPTPGSGHNALDGTYEKALLKGEIKVDPKLGDDNWQSWSEAMELLLAAKMLWDKVDGTTPCPSITTRPKDNKAWVFDNTQARMWIFVNCETAQQVISRTPKP